MPKPKLGSRRNIKYNHTAVMLVVVVDVLLVVAGVLCLFVDGLQWLGVVLLVLGMLGYWLAYRLLKPVLPPQQPPRIDESARRSATLE